MEFSMKVCFK